MDIATAILHCRPNAKFAVAETYESIVWHDTEQEKPTLSELQNAWVDVLHRKASQPKRWPNAHAFWENFTPPEQLAILSSSINEIRLLDRALVLWQGEVWSDDPRVQQGIDALVAAGILAPERRASIVG